MSSLRGATKKFVEDSFLRETDECILWPHALHPSGYPTAHDAAGVYKPHRRICEMMHGAAPTPKHHAAHKCGNRVCINKRHLVWATAKENVADKKVHGTNKGLRKIGVDAARDILWRAAEGESIGEIAADYPTVSYNAVKKIVQRKTYQELSADTI